MSRDHQYVGSLMSTSPNSHVVSARDVTVVRDGNTILEGVDWDIGPGEGWVVFGPNGSGKTTLIEVVSSYLFPTRGTVSVLGETLRKTDARELRARIGYVGPLTGRFIRANFRVSEIVVTGLHASFVGPEWHDYRQGDWDRAIDCLRQVGAEELAERTFKTLSEGEKKRVILARSLMTEPRLILLDEAYAALDLGARERLVGALANLVRADRSVVVVTHHVEEIPPGFANILMLSGGRVVACGPIEDALTSESLSRTFDLPLEVNRQNGRWRARGAG